MLRLLILLVSFVKLVLVGKWYPPAHVRDVSARSFLEVVEAVKLIDARLRACERQTESTRQKVYRATDKGEAAQEDVPQPAAPPATSYQAGDEVTINRP